jgi:anti-sigma factor RsiW
MPRNTPDEEELKTSAEDEEAARRLVNESMTPQQQEAFYAKALERERETVRQRVRQIKENELTEKAREQVRKEARQGVIPPKPPQPWGEYLQENASYAFNKVHNFAVVYITAENATYGVGALAVGGMAVTKKGAAVAAAVKTGVVAAVVANPVAAVGGAILVGYGAYQYKHWNDPAPVMATVPENTPRPHAM